MTISNPELPQRPTQPNPEAWLPEDEIDLRQYVLVLVAWWREIVLIALLTAVAAAALVLLSRFILPPAYEATATVTIARTQSNISFDDRFQTSVAQGDVTANSRVIDYSARRSSLLGLVASNNIAQAVIEQLGDNLNEDEQRPSYLLKQVVAELGEATDTRSASDLILITVNAETAQKAAEIANAWAENYVALVNKLYGEVPTELLASVIVELGQSQIAYDQAQQSLEDFIASNEIARLDRLIAEKQDIIQSLQKGRQTAITTIVDEELAARGQIISAYITAQANNRLLAFNKEQDAKRGIISALIQADTNNRLQALQVDQDARNQIFKAYADADTRSKVAVFSEQVEQKLRTLSNYYDRKHKLDRLLSEAQGLWLQVSLGDEASVQSNSLALLLLKTQVYASSTDLPVGLQLRLDDLSGAEVSAGDQAKDVDVLVDVLRTQLSELDRLITFQSRLVFNNEGYDLLDAQRPIDDPLYIALQQKYSELFNLGPLAQAATVFSDQTPLFASIQAQYPGLFDIGALSALTEQVATDSTPLALLSEERAKELLQLQGLEDLPSYTASAEPLIQAIDKLEKDIQSLQAQREKQSATRDQLIRQRDLTLGTLNTLRNKNAELKLTTTVTNSELRFASPAVEPMKPVERLGLIITTALAGIVGLMLAVFVVFFANFMGAQPWLGRREVYG